MSTEKREDMAVTQPLYPNIQGQGQQYPEANPCPPYTPTAPAIVVEQPQVIRGQSNTGKRKAFVGQIVLSCVVTWCCCSPFGLIGFILAMVGNCKSSNGDVQESRRLGKASYGLSVTGLIIGFIFFSILIGIYIGLLLANRGYFKFIGS